VEKTYAVLLLIVLAYAVWKGLQAWQLHRQRLRVKLEAVPPVPPDVERRNPELPGKARVVPRTEGDGFSPNTTQPGLRVQRAVFPALDPTADKMPVDVIVVGARRATEAAAPPVYAAPAVVPEPVSDLPLLAMESEEDSFPLGEDSFPVLEQEPAYRPELEHRQEPELRHEPERRQEPERRPEPMSTPAPAPVAPKPAPAVVPAFSPVAPPPVYTPDPAPVQTPVMEPVAEATMPVRSPEPEPVVPLAPAAVVPPLPIEQHDLFAGEPLTVPPAAVQPQRRDSVAARASALYETGTLEPVNPLGNSASQPKVHEEVQDVIAVHVVARQHPFHGEDLLRCILSYGLRFGEMSIFHRHEKPTGQGRVLFSMAKAVEPGTFDLEGMTGEAIPGVSFFQSLPGINSIHAYDIMMDTAKRLATELDGEILDLQQNPMTRQLIEHYRERVTEFERRRLMERR
jgi:cell division protein ZipA